MFLKLIFPQKFHRFLSRSLMFWLLLTLIIRFFLMAFTIHPDFFFIHMFPNLFVSHGISNIYQIFNSNQYLKTTIYYSPLVFIFFSLVQLIFKPINAGFSELMDNAFKIDASSFNTNPIIYFQGAQDSVYINFFLMKLPYLLFDIVLLAILIRLSNNWTNAKKIFFISLFNPVVLYGTYMFGQFDIIPTTLLLLGIYLVIARKLLSGMLLIGLSAALKNFSLILILPVALSVGKDFKEKIKLSLYGFLPFVVSFLAFFLQAPNQAIYMIIPKFYVEKVNLNPAIFSTVSKIARYSILFLSYGLVLFSANFIKTSKAAKVIGLSLISLLLLFALSPIVLFHYVTIVIPLLVIFLVEKKWFTSSLALYITSIAIFKNWTRIQQLGLLAPINKRFYEGIQSTSEIVSNYISYSVISSTFYIIFFITSVVFILVSFKKIIFQSPVK